MSLDLDDLTTSWSCPAGEICARVVRGRDGQELLQLRIDLGVLQMFPDGRPDGGRYHEHPSVTDHMHQEFMAGRKPRAEDWRELEREFSQLNYRRLALASLADEALKRNDKDAARAHLLRAVRDIELCMRLLRTGERRPNGPAEQTGLRPTLTFNRARLRAQLRVVEGLYDEAVEEAEAGARTLESVLMEAGMDTEQSERDAGVLFLQQLGFRLRKEYGIERTLQERLDAAVENEDFETAAQLREELRRRQQSIRKTLPPPAE